MTHEQVIRAWKDENYRRSLSEAELSALPENPAGFVELSDHELSNIAGQEEAGTTTLPCAWTFYLITKIANCLPTILRPGEE